MGKVVPIPKDKELKFNEVCLRVYPKTRVKTEHRLYEYVPRVYATAITQEVPDPVEPAGEDTRQINYPVVGQGWIILENTNGAMIKSTKGAPPFLPYANGEENHRNPFLAYAGHKNLGGGVYVPVLYMVFEEAGGVWESLDAGETWTELPGVTLPENSNPWQKSLVEGIAGGMGNDAIAHFGGGGYACYNTAIPLGDGVLACGIYDGSVRFHPLQAIDRVTVHEEYDPPLELIPGEPPIYSHDEDFILQLQHFTFDHGWEVQNKVVGGPVTRQWGGDDYEVYTVERTIVGWFYAGKGPTKANMLVDTLDGNIVYSPDVEDSRNWDRTNTHVFRSATLNDGQGHTAKGTCYTEKLISYIPCNNTYYLPGEYNAAWRHGTELTLEALKIYSITIPEFTSEGGSTPNPAWGYDFGDYLWAYARMCTGSFSNDGSTIIKFQNSIPEGGYLRIEWLPHYGTHYHGNFPIPYVTETWQSGTWANGQWKEINHGDSSTNWRMFTDFRNYVDDTPPATTRTIDKWFVKEAYDDIVNQSGGAWSVLERMFLGVNYSGDSLAFPSSGLYPFINAYSSFGNPRPVKQFGDRLFYDYPVAGWSDFTIMGTALVKWDVPPVGGGGGAGIIDLMSAQIQGGFGMDILPSDPDYPDAGNIIPFGWLGGGNLYGLKFSGVDEDYRTWVYSQDVGKTWSEVEAGSYPVAPSVPIGWAKFRTVHVGPRTAVVYWGSIQPSDPYDNPYSDNMWITHNSGKTWESFTPLGFHLLPWTMHSTRRNEFIYAGKDKDMEAEEDWDKLFKEFAVIEERDFTSPNHSNYIRVKCDRTLDASKVAEFKVRFNKVEYPIFKVEGAYIYIQDPSVAPESRNTDLDKMFPKYAGPRIRSETLDVEDYLGQTIIDVDYPPIIGSGDVPFSISVGSTTYTAKALGSGADEAENNILEEDFFLNKIHLTEPIADPDGAGQIVISYGIEYHARVHYKVDKGRYYLFCYRKIEQAFTEDVIEAGDVLTTANNILEVLSIHSVNPVSGGETYVQPFSYSVDSDNLRVISGSWSIDQVYRVRYIGSPVSNGSEHKRLCSLPATFTPWSEVKPTGGDYDWNNVYSDIIPIGTMYKHCGEHDHLDEPESPVPINWTRE